MRKKLGFILPYPYPIYARAIDGLIGGTQSRGRQLVEAFSERGYEVIVYSLSFTGGQQQFTVKDIMYKRYGYYNSRQGQKAGWKSINQSILNEGIDKTLLILTSSAGLREQFKLLQNLNQEDILTIVSLTLDNYVQKLNDKQLEIIGNSDVVITQQEYTRKELVKELQSLSSIITIPNPIDSRKFTPVSNQKRSKIRREMDFAPDELILLSTNRLVKYKGIEILINALALLPDQLNLTVLFVGNDDKANEGKALETKLKTLNAKKKNLEIILEGKQPYSIINKYYKVADIYTLNSFREGMSNSLLEAMSSSLPVIVSDIKANTSLIRDGYNGLVYARENAMDLNKAIRELAANTELRLTYGNNNREKILKEFCKKKVINSYVELLEAN